MESVKVKNDATPQECDFDQSILQYKEGNSRLREKLPNVAQTYFDFTEACFQEGAISKKYKQLIALAISIYAQNEHCINYHAKGAAEHGASRDEVMETIAVSAALGGGSTFSQGVTSALESYDYFSRSI